MKRLSLSLAAIALAAGLQLQAQDPDPHDGRHRGPPQLTPEQQEAVAQHRLEVEALVQQIDTILVGENEEYATLSAKEDKTFDERRQLATLRRQLIEGSDAAQAVVAQIQTLRDTFREEHDLPPPPGFGRPGSPVRGGDGRPPRPVTEADREALQAHREAMEGKQVELNTILAAASERYAELIAGDPRDLSPEERGELRDLRRTLIADNEAAQVIVEQIHELNVAFREDNPGLAGRFGRGDDRRLNRARETVTAIKTLRDSIDELLAENSEEFAALLAQADKSPEDIARMVHLRRELIAANEDATQLQASLDLLKARLQDRQIRNPRRPHHLRPAPTDAPPHPTDGAADEADGDE